MSQGRKFLNALLAINGNATSHQTSTTRVNGTILNDVRQTTLPTVSAPQRTKQNVGRQKSVPPTSAPQPQSPLLNVTAGNDDCEIASFTSSDRCMLNPEWLRAHYTHDASAGAADDWSSASKTYRESGSSVKRTYSTVSSTPSKVNAADKVKQWLFKSAEDEASNRFSSNDKDPASPSNVNDPTTPNINTPDTQHQLSEVTLHDDNLELITPEQPILSQENINPTKHHVSRQIIPDAPARKQLFSVGIQSEAAAENVLIIPLDDPVVLENIEIGELHSQEAEVIGELELHSDQSQEREVSSKDTSSQKRKRNNAPSDSPATKKRKIKPSAWKANQVKLAYNSGVAHVSMRGKKKAARSMKAGCGEKCRKKCSSLISNERRQQLFQKYWGLKDKMLQWYFLSKLIQPVAVKKRKGVNEGSPFRQNNNEYFLSDRAGNCISVCQTMFVETFDISVRVVRTALHKNSPDKRGKHAHHKKLSPILLNGVKDHIKSFPMVPSHYCRADTNRKYLDEHLNVSKMHRLYLMDKDINDKNTATLRQYRDIFNTYFNLSFFQPKKDQCSQCAEWKLTEENAESYNLHQKSKQHVRDLKTSDKILSRDSSQGNSRVITCDLQKVLYCPKSDLGEFYYKRKVSVYNFTVFDCTVRDGYLYVWDETCGKKGSDETSSFLKLYIEEQVKNGITKFTLYSDSCGGQNKNQFLYTMFYALAIKHNITIIHRYLEKGHTQMECDSVHARVEKKIKKEDVFTPSQYYGFMKTAKVKKPVYKVHEVKQSEIFNYRKLAKHLTWSKIPISKVREIVFDPSPGTVQYRTEWEKPSKTVPIVSRTVGRPVNWATVEPELSYTGTFKLKPKLVKDLAWYLKKGHIPQEFVPVYQRWIDGPATVDENNNQHEEEDDTPQEIEPSLNAVNNIMERQYADHHIESADPLAPDEESCDEPDEVNSNGNDSDSD